MNNAMGLLQIAVDAYNDHVRDCRTCTGTFFQPGTQLPGHGTACEDGWSLLANIEAKAAVGSKHDAKGDR